jgi:hypothetical protein
LQGTEVHLDELDGVGQEEGDGVTAGEAEGPEAAGHLVGTVEHLPGGAFRAVGSHQRQALAVLFGQSPESEVCHDSGL